METETLAFRGTAKSEVRARHMRNLTLLRVTTLCTFVSENSALGAKLIVAARSQGDVRLKRWFDDSITTLSMLGFCSIML